MPEVALSPQAAAAEFAGPDPEPLELELELAEPELLEEEPPELELPELLEVEPPEPELELLEPELLEPELLELELPPAPPLLEVEPPPGPVPAPELLLPPDPAPLLLLPPLLPPRLPPLLLLLLPPCAAEAETDAAVPPPEQACSSAPSTRPSASKAARVPRRVSQQPCFEVWFTGPLRRLPTGNLAPPARRIRPLADAVQGGRPRGRPQCECAHLAGVMTQTMPGLRVVRTRGRPQQIVGRAAPP